MTVFIGIDPGQSGGIAYLVGANVFAFKMPETERDLWEQIQRGYREFPSTEERFAVIERVHSMPKQGVASSFKFGMNYGALRMALVASSHVFEEVSPRVWQKELSCLSGGNKNVTKARAQQLFPTLTIPGQKITHATADALLLAEYARRLWVHRNRETA